MIYVFFMIGVTGFKLFFSYLHQYIIKSNMQSSSNIVHTHINIQSYLNLGLPTHEHHHYQYLDEQFDQVPEQLYSNLQSSIHESEILLSNQRGRSKGIRQTQASQLSSHSHKKSAKQATAKYRQRRKQYQHELQSQVKQLQQQLTQTQTQIKQVKDALLIKLQSSIKSVHSTENAQIYHELQNCIPKNGEDEELADIDKINLLLNTLKFRIGPTGRQRHAKIQYNFKNIVNTLFPGLLRYFIITAAQNKDLFSIAQSDQTAWTHELMHKINLSQSQKQKIKQSQQKLKVMHSGTMNKISRLKAIKLKMKEQALMMDKEQDQIRQNMSAVQCAKLTMFCQRHKFRKNIALDQKFRPKMCGTMVEEEMEELLQCRLGRKRVHRDPEAV